MIYIAYQLTWIFVVHAEGLIGTGEVHCLNQSPSTAEIPMWAT